MSHHQRSSSAHAAILEDNCSRELERRLEPLVQGIYQLRHVERVETQLHERRLEIERAPLSV